MDQVPIFDGHNDALLDLHYESRGSGRSFFEESESGHLDLPRARVGGMTGGLFAIYVPPDPAADDRAGSMHVRDDDGEYIEISPALTERYARTVAFDIASRLHRLAGTDDVDVVRTASELRASFNSDRMTAVMHLKGGAPIGHDLDYLDMFYEAGLRSLGPVWSRPNAFGHGVPFTYPNSPDVGPGLTEAGERLVEACNERGIGLTSRTSTNRDSGT